VCSKCIKQIEFIGVFVSDKEKFTMFILSLWLKNVESFIVRVYGSVIIK
jgi:hypothetical protein